MADAVLEGKQIREEMMQAEQDKEVEEPEPPEKSILEMGNAPDLEEGEPEAAGTPAEETPEETKEEKTEAEAEESKEAEAVKEEA